MGSGFQGVRVILGERSLRHVLLPLQQLAFPEASESLPCLRVGYSWSYYLHQIRSYYVTQPVTGKGNRCHPKAQLKV